MTEQEISKTLAKYGIKLVDNNGDRIDYGIILYNCLQVFNLGNNDEKDEIKIALNAYENLGTYTVLE
jgi:hypothetical protein